MAPISLEEYTANSVLTAPLGWRLHPPRAFDWRPAVRNDRCLFRDLHRPEWHYLWHLREFASGDGGIAKFHLRIFRITFLVQGIWSQGQGFMTKRQNNAFYWSSGSFSGSGGKSQTSIRIFRQTGTGSLRLTVDQNAAGGQNTYLAPVSSAHNIGWRCNAIDTTTPANTATWSTWRGGGADARFFGQRGLCRRGLVRGDAGSIDRDRLDRDHHAGRRHDLQWPQRDLRAAKRRRCVARAMPPRHRPVAGELILGPRR